MSELVIISKELRNPRRTISDNERLRLFFLSEQDSLGTKQEYKRALSEFIAFLRNEFLITEMLAKREHINSFKNYLLFNKKNSKVTINKKLSVVSSYYIFLITKNALKENPCRYIKRFKISNFGKSVAIARDEVLLLYKSLPVRTLREKQFKTMIVILFETGIRVSELLCLRIGSIKKDFGEYVLEFQQKGDRLHRVKLNEVGLSFLGQHLEIINDSSGLLNDNEYLFRTSNGTPYNRKNFYRSLKTINVKLGINIEIHPHTARVSFIKQKHKEGVDIYSIKKMVGHSSINTTERYLNG